MARHQIEIVHDFDVIIHTIKAIRVLYFLKTVTELRIKLWPGRVMII